MSSLLANFKLSSLTFVLALVLAGCGGAPASDTGTDPSADPGAGGGDSSSVQIGSGGGSSFAAGEASAVLQGTGSETTATWDVSVVVVDENNLAVTDAYTVTFTSTCVSAGLASLDNTSVDTVAGRAAVTYSSGSCTGVDTVVASISSGVSATADLDIDANTNSDGGGTGTIDTTVRIGSGSGVGFVESALSAGSVSLQAGSATNISASLVDSDGELIAQSATVTFSSSCVSDGISSFDQSSVGTTAGQAVARYTAEGCVGDDVITANSTINGTVLTATVTVNVTADTVSGLEFISVAQPALSLPGTGGIETTEVVFRVLGELGAPVTGESVSFELNSAVGGLSIASSRVSDISDQNGLVSTQVRSGTVSTTFNVIATHDSTGNATTSDSITVSSGAPVQSKFSLSLSRVNPRLAFNTDNVEVEVSVIASDYFGNDVPDGSQVFFASPESGNIDSSCFLISGQCTVEWRSAGDRPADLRATIIAYTSGAEDYTDANANNVFDGADTAGQDLTEPYVDENENDVYDVGELFVDANSNGVWDAGNGLWDGPCLSAVDASADCSGDDSVIVYETATIIMPTETPRLISLSVSYDGGDTFTPFNVGDTLYTGNGTNDTIIVAAVVGDDNELADPFGGHPLTRFTTASINNDFVSGLLSDNSVSSTEFDFLNNSTEAGTAFATMVDLDNTSPSVRNFIVHASSINSDGGNGYDVDLGTFLVVFDPE